MTGEAPGLALAGVAAERLWRFAGHEFDERSLQLWVAGKPADIDGKPLGVLRHLLLHAGEVVTKDELASAVWPRRILAEGVLTKTISRLREVLGDESQDIIKTVHGYGYRLVAQVAVEERHAPAPTTLDLKAGDSPPLRPLWKLEQRLGTGGHGEAWSAAHQKTRELRVFKFALDEASLVSLKREITLYRVINDTLGERARVVNLLDWNLEQQPYFIESEYLAGGSLLDWARSRGGLHNIPLAERLEVVAQIAEALAAVHGVGVLHKDLKPSNLLVHPLPQGGIQIRLADFGSGVMLDVHQLEKLGITRAGWTRTIDNTSGTPLYLAPEIVNGQPFTVKADLYALGVILHQFVTANFRTPLSPGWERGIDDELLREDIAAAADGNVEARLGDAGELARRLRTLDERRQQRKLEREAQARAEKAQRALERAKARRVGLAAAVVALVVGLIASTTLYLKARAAQGRTEVAAAQSKAVTDFLSNDVFAPVSSGEESVKNTTVFDLLTRAGKKIDERFAAQPEVASELHFVVGKSMDAFYETPAAAIQYRLALETALRLEGEGSKSAMRAAFHLTRDDYVTGKLPTTIESYRDILRRGRRGLRPDDPTLLDLRMQLGRGEFWIGNWSGAVSQLEELLADLELAPAAVERSGHAELYLGQTLSALWRLPEARVHLSRAIEQLSAALGDDHADVSEARAALGRVLTDGGDYAEAQVQLDTALKIARLWADDMTWTVGRPLWFTGLLRFEQDRLPEAEALLSEQIKEVDDGHAPYLATHQDVGGGELDRSGPERQALGEVYLREGKTAIAITTLTQALQDLIVAEGPQHPLTVSCRLALAEALVAAGRADEAHLSYTQATATNLDALGAFLPLAVQRERVAGLLARAHGDRDEAQKNFARALKTEEALRSPRHWRVLRLRQELASVSPPKGG